MQHFSKKINLYSMVKSYFSIFLMFILYTFGYSAINHPAGAEEFINSIMSFSPEVKTLSITGTLLLFLILIYEKLSNQESSSQNSSSSIKGNASKVSDVPLSTLAAGTELPNYDIMNSSALINNQPVSTPSSISNSALSITPLELDPHHSRELDLDGQQISILKQIVPVATKVLLCSLVAGIAILSCGLVIEALIKGQQLLPTILEFTNSVGSLLGISSSTLLAVAFVPMVALTIFSILSKSVTHAQDNIGHVLEKSQPAEVERARVKSNGGEKNPKSKSRSVSTSSSQEANHHKRWENEDWEDDPLNPFSNTYNCTNLTIERFLHEPEKALG